MGIEFCACGENLAKTLLQALGTAGEGDAGTHYRHLSSEKASSSSSVSSGGGG